MELYWQYMGRCMCPAASDGVPERMGVLRHGCGGTGAVAIVQGNQEVPGGLLKTMD